MQSALPQSHHRERQILSGSQRLSPHGLMSQALLLLSSGLTECFPSLTFPRLLLALWSLHTLFPSPETRPLHLTLSLQPQFSISPWGLE